MPREQFPDHPRRQLINETNKILKKKAKKDKIRWVDIGPKMLTSNGELSKEIASDFCHPTDKGYQIWADAIRPLLK